MLKTIKGTYNNGMVELLEMPSEIQTQTDVFVIFFIPEMLEQEISDIGSLCDSKIVVTAQLSTLLQRVQDSFPLQDEYTVYFEKFVQIVNERLVALYEDSSHNHLRLLVLLKTALHRLQSVNLTFRHLTLFGKLLSLLTNQVIISDEIVDLQKQFCRAGIDTMMGIEEQDGEFVELYEKNDDYLPQRSVGEAFAELRQLCLEEEYTFEAPLRRDRPNAFVEMLDEWDEEDESSM